MYKKIRPFNESTLGFQFYEVYKLRDSSGKITLPNETSATMWSVNKDLADKAKLVLAVVLFMNGINDAHVRGGFLIIKNIRRATGYRLELQIWLASVQHVDPKPTTHAKL